MIKYSRTIVQFPAWFFSHGHVPIDFSNSSSCRYQGRKFSFLEVTSVLLSGLDDCTVRVHWLWSWDANILLCFAQSLSVLETVLLLAANTLTAGLSQWFRKGIFYQNKKPSGVAGTDQKPSASWQIAFYARLGFESNGGRKLHIHIMKANA